MTEVSSEEISVKSFSLNESCWDHPTRASWIFIMYSTSWVFCRWLNQSDRHKIKDNISILIYSFIFCNLRFLILIHFHLGGHILEQGCNDRVDVLSMMALKPSYWKVIRIWFRSKFLLHVLVTGIPNLCSTHSK